MTLKEKLDEKVNTYLSEKRIEEERISKINQRVLNETPQKIFDKIEEIFLEIEDVEVLVQGCKICVVKVGSGLEVQECDLTKRIKLVDFPDEITDRTIRNIMKDVFRLAEEEGIEPCSYEPSLGWETWDFSYQLTI